MPGSDRPAKRQARSDMTTPSRDALARRRRAFAMLRDALDIDEAARQAWIDEAAAGDDALAAEVRALLAASSPRLLDGDVAAVASRLSGDDEPLPSGTGLGGWNVLHTLGSGGMGVVYRVERSGDGFVQAGALKLVKRGMDSAAVLARFRLEREILARLAHPNIAHLLDGGIADSGQPYLVMEYVEGEPIGQWTRRTRATLDARVVLFLALCDAVAHAHRQLVVHRDIKPGNVIVDAHDRPHLLDFGIAKLLESDAPEHTATAARFVSRAYAAPEQVGDGAITTATDIYQLGVLLFELLTDVRHADAAGTTRSSQRLALARAAGGAGPIAPRDLEGDPGVIVARATDPDPVRRYATVEAFAEDLRRWREGRPIHARPDSTGYRLRLFVRRNRLLVVASTMALAAIVAGAGAALWQARKAEAEARLARSAQTFLASVFDSASPDADAGARVTARELLDRGSERIARELADQPHLRGEMQRTLGALYAQLGQYAKADALLADARASLDAASADAEVRARAVLDHVAVEREMDRLDDASRDVAWVIEHTRDDALHARALAERASVRERRGEFDAALGDARAALRIDLAHGEVALAEQARDRQIEALLLTRLAHFDAAAATFERALADARAAWGARDTRVAQMLNDYGATLGEQGRAEAETAIREALAIRRERLGDDHPAVAESLQILARTLRAQGRLDETRDALVEALRIQRAAYGDRHALVANTLNSIGMLAFSRRLPAEAEPSFREAVDIFHERGMNDVPSAATTANNLATVLVQLGRYDEAEPLMHHALEVHLARVGEQHPAVMSVLNSLSQLDLRRGRLDSALGYGRRALAIADSPASPAREGAYLHISFATLLNRAGHAQEALDVLAPAIQTLHGLDADEARLPAARTAEAEALLGLGRIDDARATAERALADRKRLTPGDAAGIAMTHVVLARIADARHRPDEARDQRRRAHALIDGAASPDPYLLAEIDRRAR